VQAPVLYYPRLEEGCQGGAKTRLQYLHARIARFRLRRLYHRLRPSPERQCPPAYRQGKGIPHRLQYVDDPAVHAKYWNRWKENDMGRGVRIMTNAKFMGIFALE